MVTVDSVIDYVLHTPDNINPVILRQLLIELSGSSEEEVIYDGGDVEGY